MSKKTNILLIRFSSIGDICLTFPLVRQLSQNHNIYFLTYHQFKDVLNPVQSLLTETILFEKKRIGLQVNHKIKNKYKFDLVIDLHVNFRSLLVRLKLFHIPFLVFDKRRIERLVHLKLKKDIYLNHASIGRRYLNETKLFLKQDLNQSSSGQWDTDSENLPDKEKIILIAAGASFRPKRWPLKFFFRVVEDILSDSDFDSYKIIFIGQEDDQFEKIKVFQQTSHRLENLIGQTDLAALYEIMKKSTILLTNDSGPMHMGICSNLSVVAIFGPTHPYFGFIPEVYEGQLKVFEQKLACRPCSLIGDKNCHRPENYCFTLTDPQRVFNQLKRMVIN